MFHKVESVRPLPNYLLEVRFQCGVCKRYDVKPLFARWKEFQVLHQVNGLFEQVRVDAGGYGIIWNNSLDLACEELWENSSPAP